MSSNLGKQYRHDALLHPVVLRSLLGSKKIRITQSHWLAFYAGLLTTLLRAELQGDPIIDDLVELFFQTLQDQRAGLPPALDQLDLPGLYYFLVVRRRLRQIAGSEDNAVRGIAAVSDRFWLQGGFNPSAPQQLFQMAREWWRDPVLAKNFARAATRSVF